MKHQEKKFLVDSFSSILLKLRELGCHPKPEKTSTHYYTHQARNDVVKLVADNRDYEVHVLKEANGKFTLTERIPLNSKEADFDWLKRKGYQAVDVVKMSYTDYIYQEGTIGLYTINNFLCSVILDFPEGEHEEIIELLELAAAEPLTVPYNKYLAALGKLKTIGLE